VDEQATLNRLINIVDNTLIAYARNLWNQELGNKKKVVQPMVIAA